MRKSPMQRVREALTDDLRRPPWRGSPGPLAGHCYVASEALYHYLGADKSEWQPATVKHEGVTHWFLRHREDAGLALDLTKEQFDTFPDWRSGRGRGFLTKQPSRRAQIVLDRLKETE